MRTVCGKQYPAQGYELEDFFSTVEIDPSLLADPQLNTQTSTHATVKSDSRGLGVPQFAIESAFNFYQLLMIAGLDNSALVYDYYFICIDNSR